MKYLKLYEDFALKNILSLDKEIEELHNKQKELQLFTHEKEHERYVILKKQKEFIIKFIDKYTNKENKTIEINLKIPKEITDLINITHDCDNIKSIGLDSINEYSVFFNKTSKEFYLGKELKYIIYVDELNYRLIALLVDFINEKYPEFESQNQFDFYD